MSRVRASMSGEGVGMSRGYVKGRGMTYPMMHVMSPTPPTPHGQTDVCKNITFPQIILVSVTDPGFF